MKPELEEEINRFLFNHCGNVKIIKGFGMTEISAAGSVCISNDCNKIGSVGIPYAHTIISIFDIESGKELPYGQSGEICISGPNTMLGYYMNEEETQKILRRHNDGRLWVHSGDIGYMDTDGCLFVEGRLKRLIVRYDGFKIFPNMIENVIGKCNYVRACCAVGMEDKEHLHGDVPIVYIQLKDNTGADHNEIKTEIFRLCKDGLPEYAQPIKMVFCDHLPLTPIGKVDYRKLEKDAMKMEKEDDSLVG